MHRNHRHGFPGKRDRREVLDRVKRHLPGQELAHHMGSRRCRKNGVAIRGSLHHRLGALRATGSRH